jgi:molybdopterin molybdotransferase
MIQYATALHRLLSNTIRIHAERCTVTKAPGRILAKDFKAPESLPRHTYSAMDGYATTLNSIVGASKESPISLEVIGESRPGSTYAGSPIRKGQAVAVATGGTLPHGADAVVPVEWTQSGGQGQVSISRIPQRRQYFRMAGGDVKKGAVLLKKGIRLNAGALAVIAQFAIEEVEVIRRPRIGIVTSGDELVPLGHPVGGDRIVATNLYYSAHSLSDFGCDTRIFGIAPDRPGALEKLLRKSLDWADATVTLAGVSAGKHDYVTEALKAVGARTLFHKVAIKPGKPTLFALVKMHPILSLPGNPLSAACTLEVLVKPYFRKCMGMRETVPRPIHARLAETAVPDERRLTFFFARLQSTDDGFVVHPPRKQESGNLSLLAGANGLAQVESGREPLPAGTFVPVWPLV